MYTEKLRETCLQSERWNWRERIGRDVGACAKRRKRKERGSEPVP